MICSLFEVATSIEAGTGNEFNNTVELKPINYNDAMNCESSVLWNESVQKGGIKFVKVDVVFKAVRN